VQGIKNSLVFWIYLFSCRDCEIFHCLCFTFFCRYWHCKIDLAYGVGKWRM